MKTKLTLVALAFVVLFASAWTFQSKPQTWEYHVEHHGTISKKKLNELGAEGWELTSAASTGSGITSNVITFVFKRPKP